MLQFTYAVLNCFERGSPNLCDAKLQSFIVNLLYFGDDW